MATQSYSAAVISDHAAEQIKRRGIGLGEVRAVLRDPGQILEVRPGRIVLQSKRKVGDRVQLVRVFVDVDESPIRVVTAYRTGKIEKYWSPQ